MTTFPVKDEQDMKEAVADAVRGMLGDNPCVLLSDDPNDRLYFSNPQLYKAFLAGLVIHNAWVKKEAKRLHQENKGLGS